MSIVSTGMKVISTGVKAVTKGLGQVAKTKSASYQLIDRPMPKGNIVDSLKKVDPELAKQINEMIEEEAHRINLKG